MSIKGISVFNNIDLNRWFEKINKLISGSNDVEQDEIITVNKNIYFSDFIEVYPSLNKDGFLSDKFSKQLFELIPSLFNYEEEGEKLSFKILLIKDLIKEKRSLPNYLFQKIDTVKEDSLNIKKIVKSMAPFSLNGWDLYISLNEDNTYEFGIYKDLSGVNSLDICTILASDYFIEIEKIDKYKLAFKNNADNYILHLSVENDIGNIDKKNHLISLVNKFTDNFENDKKNKFNMNVINALFHNTDKIHGTIIVVQDANKGINGFIKKGILFDKPINLFDEYMNFINSNGNIDNIPERYYSFLGILTVTMNIDGITLINNNAEILGYNIFIDNENVDTSKVIGGARKRAAYSIENSNIPGLIGIYFQSHDGDNYFKEL